MQDNPLAPFVPRVVTTWGDPAQPLRRIDGALLFVDISGFTAMSERLAVLGREGAERVTDIISDAFTALLAEAYAHGASLLKFGGDALLLLFEGDRAAERAAVSAVEMRATLREVGRVPTPAGAVTLRMSCGIHAGEIHLFLVGEHHHELVVTGPAATAVVDAESGAGAGNIVVSPAAAAQIAPRCIGRQHGSGHLLTRAPDVSGREEPTLNTGTNLERFIPLAIRTHLAHESRDLAEHRRATIAFLHFDGTDELVTADADAAGAALHELVTVVEAAAERHDVAVLSTDIDHDGGKLILSSGAPLVHEDDEVRVVLAVREALDAATTIPLRAGVHAGSLLAAEVGPPYRRFYTVMGDVVNTAARIMSRAAPGELLVSEETMARVDVSFEAEALEPFAVKGKAEPLRAVRLGARQHADEDDTIGDDEAVFVGRERVVADLLARWADAVEGRGSVIELVGEAGVGKTEVLREVLRSPDAAPVEGEVVVLRCHRSLEKTPYGVLQGTLRTIIGLSANEAPARVRTRLAAILEAMADRVDERLDNLGLVLGFTDTDKPVDREAAGFLSLLSDTIDQMLSAAFPSGAFIVVENAQWIDASSLALIRRLARRIRERPWLVAATRRPGVHGALGGHEVELDQLTPEQAVELAVAQSGGKLLSTEARAIVDRTGGNPLFIREIVGLLEADPAAELDELPASLEALFASKIDHLDAAERATVRALAVLGIEFERGEASILLGVDDDELDELLRRRADILHEHEGRIRFSDALLQDAAYNGMSYRRRRELHQQAGLRIEAALDDPELRADALATHFIQSGDVERTWRYGVVAGRRAMARHGYAEAARLLRDALRAASELQVVDADARDAWTTLAWAHYYQGRAEDAIGPLRRARALADSAEARAELCWREGVVRRELGRFLAAVRWFRRGLRDLEHADRHVRDRLTVKLLLGEGMVRFLEYKFEESEHDLRRALAIAEEIGDEASVADACRHLVDVFGHMGANRESLEELGRRALTYYERTTGNESAIAATRNALGLAATQANDWRAAVEHLRAAASACHAIDRPVDAAIAEFNLAFLVLRQGRPDEARSLLARAVTAMSAVDHGYTPIIRAALACAQDCVATSAEEHTEAAIAFEQANASARNAGIDGFLADWWVLWADAAAERGDVETLTDRLGDIPTPMDPSTTANVARLSAHAALLRGDPQGAGDLAEWALSLAQDLEDLFMLGRCHAIAAEVARQLGRDASTHDRAATEALEPLGVETAPFWGRQLVAA